MSLRGQFKMILYEMIRQYCRLQMHKMLGGWAESYTSPFCQIFASDEAFYGSQEAELLIRPKTV